MPRCTYGTSNWARHWLDRADRGPLVDARMLRDGDRAEGARLIREAEGVRIGDPAARSSVQTRPSDDSRRGASTVAAAPAPIAMPWCRPVAYGCAGSNDNVCRTGPWTGQVHAPAAGTKTSMRVTPEYAA